MSPKDIYTYINEKFKTKFTLDQIKYKIYKLFEEQMGKPQEDAYRFAELAQKYAIENNGFFVLNKDIDGVFERALFVSDCMYKYSEYFLDIIIVDATYKKNRFSLPLISIIGIDNLGHNIMLAFSLMKDEKKESYKWLFQELKKIWKRDPLNIISDDSNEIHEGFYF